MFLVGGFNLEKYIYMSMGRVIPYIMENKTCCKPPTSIPHFKSSPAFLA
jgi:hypothetical protein